MTEQSKPVTNEEISEGIAFGVPGESVRGDKKDRIWLVRVIKEALDAKDSEWDKLLHEKVQQALDFEKKLDEKDSQYKAEIELLKDQVAYYGWPEYSELEQEIKKQKAEIERLKGHHLVAAYEREKKENRTLKEKLSNRQTEIERLQQDCAKIASENACKIVEIHDYQTVLEKVKEALEEVAKWYGEKISNEQFQTSFTTNENEVYWKAKEALQLLNGLGENNK